MTTTKICVIGSNSFSGSFVAESLSAGHQVLGLSRSCEPDSVFYLTDGLTHQPAKALLRKIISYLKVLI